MYHYFVSYESFRRMRCNDLSWLTITNIEKMHESLFDPKVSKNIHNQGETLFCWAFAISTMLRQSLFLFISGLTSNKFEKDNALKRLNDVEFHRQLRNELLMVPIPKKISHFYEDSPSRRFLDEEHYLDMAFDRVCSNS